MLQVGTLVKITRQSTKHNPQIMNVGYLCIVREVDEDSVYIEVFYPTMYVGQHGAVDKDCLVAITEGKLTGLARIGLSKLRECPENVHHHDR